MEIIYGMLGMYMMYTWVHFGFIQAKGWSERSWYEKYTSIIALVFIGLYVAGTL